MRMTILILTSASVISVAAAGCSEPTGPRVVANPDVAVKVPAIKQAAESRDRSEIPAMIDELNSDDPAVRLVHAAPQSVGQLFHQITTRIVFGKIAKRE